MLKVGRMGNLVTENPENYFSISVEKGEVAHMVDGKMADYANGLCKKQLHTFIGLQSFEEIEKYYNTFSKNTYE